MKNKNTVIVILGIVGAIALSFQLFSSLAPQQPVSKLLVLDTPVRTELASTTPTIRLADGRSLSPIESSALFTSHIWDNISQFIKYVLSMFKGAIIGFPQ